MRPKKQHISILGMTTGYEPKVVLKLMSILSFFPIPLKKRVQKNENSIKNYLLSKLICNLKRIDLSKLIRNLKKR